MTNSTFYHDGFRDGSAGIQHRNISPINVFQQEYSDGYFAGKLKRVLFDPCGVFDVGQDRESYTDDQDRENYMGGILR